MTKTMNGKNYFNETSFNEMITELEKGEKIQVYIDCIGHTRDAMEQSNYREAFLEKYGDKIIIEHSHLGYIYELKRDEVISK